jgi:hypothetical protein
MGSVTDLIVRRLTEEKSNFDLGVAGTRGSGKSYTALRLGYNVSQAMGTPFTIEDNVHFSALGFLEAIQRLTAGKDFGEVKPGNVLILDEAGRSLSAQDWFESELKMVTGELETYRVYSFFTEFTSPSIQHVTKRARDMLTGFMIPDMPDVTDRYDLNTTASNIDRYHKRSYWKLQLLWNQQKPASEKKEKLFSYRPRDPDGALDSVIITYPPQDLVDDYEKKKMRFLKEEREKNISAIKSGVQPQRPSKAKVAGDMPTIIPRPGEVAVPKKNERSEAEKIIETICAMKDEWGKVDKNGKWMIYSETVRLGLRQFGIRVTGEDSVGYKQLVEKKLNRSLNAGGTAAAQNVG